MEIKLDKIMNWFKKPLIFLWLLLPLGTSQGSNLGPLAVFLYIGFLLISISRLKSRHLKFPNILWLLLGPIGIIILFCLKDPGESVTRDNRQDYLEELKGSHGCYSCNFYSDSKVNWCTESESLINNKVCNSFDWIGKVKTS